MPGKHRKRLIEERATYDGVDLPDAAAGAGIVAMSLIAYGHPEKPEPITARCSSLEERARLIEGYPFVETHILRYVEVD